MERNSDADKNKGSEQEGAEQKHTREQTAVGEESGYPQKGDLGMGSQFGGEKGKCAVGNTLAAFQVTCLVRASAGWRHGMVALITECPRTNRCYRYALWTFGMTSFRTGRRGR